LLDNAHGLQKNTRIRKLQVQEIENLPGSTYRDMGSAEFN